MTETPAPKLTPAQRKALTNYADGRAYFLFGAVDYRLKAMGLIEYVGNPRPWKEHRITVAGRAALDAS